jgi:Zn-dependent membrane protease YugP
VFSSGYILFVMLPALALSLFAQWRVKSAFAKWNQVPNERGLTGVDTARVIMQNAGLDHVRVDRVPGDLTDFYDPRDKSIHLSEGSTRRPSVAAMAVVAHELGHAQQDQAGSALLRARAALVPVANIGSNLGVWLVMLGLIFQATGLAWAGVVLFAGAVAFTLITLPVEFDASRRARAFLQDYNMVSAQEMNGVGAVLNAAALTYVAAAAGAALQLLYYVNLLSGRSRD